LKAKQLHCLGSIPVEGTFYHDLVDLLIRDLDEERYEAYYFWYGDVLPDGNVYHGDLAKIHYHKPCVLWIMIDSLAEQKEFDWYRDSKPAALVGLENICRCHPCKHFVLLTTNVGLESLIEVANLHVVELPPMPWRKTLGDYRHGYASKRNMRWHWLCLLNMPNQHRVALLSCLLGKQLDLHGQFTVSKPFVQVCRSFKHGHINDFVHYDFSQADIDQLDIGYQRLRGRRFESLQISPYPDLHNLPNYHENILPVYDHTRLEIVASTMFSEEYLHPSEKELQALYGCNFMIMISNAGMVSWLRSWGFDMFDDVINHDYDLIPQPHRRLIKAIEDNLHLLDGSTDIDALWQQRRHRFIKNCERADQVLTLLDQKTQHDFHAVLTTLA
jgi:hypothetical protein